MLKGRSDTERFAGYKMRVFFQGFCEHDKEQCNNLPDISNAAPPGLLFMVQIVVITASKDIQLQLYRNIKDQVSPSQTAFPSNC